MTNVFTNDLVYSFSKQDFWTLVYKKAFPVMLKTEDMSKDKTAQAKGIDTIIHLPFGGRLYIDEKLRRGNYTDILLEYISNDKTNSRGWVEKELCIDFIAYAFEIKKTVYFLPFKELQKLWLDNKVNWLEKYKPPKIAKNQYYNTINLAVPLAEFKSLRIITVKL